MPPCYHPYSMKKSLPPPAKKHWGQHFLKDPHTCQKIVHLLGDTTRFSAVIEVGPGRGALTQWLLPEVKVPLHLIEVDPDMVAFLATTYPSLQGQLINQDFVHFPLEQITQGDIALIGNLPYNVASQILLHAINYCHQVSHIVCMVQKEVGQRITSPPGSKRYGLLSVWTQAFYHVSYALEVPPEAFTPPPKVTSAVLHMRRHRTQLPCDEKFFFRLVKTAFQQRRKILSNALAPLGKPLDRIPEPIRTKRAEQLTIHDFIQLTQALA